MKGPKSYLDPASYESAGIYTKLLLFSSAYYIQLFLAGIAFIAFIADYLFGDTMSGALTLSLSVTFFLALLTLPNEVSSRAQALTRSGQSLSTRFADMQQVLGATTNWVMALVIPLIFGLTVYGWQAPANSKIAGLTPVFGFVTNLLVTYALAARSWRYALQKIGSGRYRSIYGGLTVLVPVGAVCGLASIISTQSGMLDWQSSISVFVPPILLSVYASLGVFEVPLMTPIDTRSKIARLKLERESIRSKIDWLQVAESRKAQSLDKRELKKQRRRLSETDRLIHLYEGVLNAYSSHVQRIMRVLLEYESRRRARDLVPDAAKDKTNSPSPTFIQSMTKAISLITPTPSSLPRPYVASRQFRMNRTGSTIMAFPALLGSKGLRPHSVNTPKLRSSSQEFDKVEFEKNRLVAFRYLAYSYEAIEIAWLWQRVQTKQSAILCFDFLSDFRASVTEYSQVVGSRLSTVDRASKADAKSDLAGISKMVKRAGYGRRGPGNPIERLKDAREAWKLISLYSGQVVEWKGAAS